MTAVLADAGLVRCARNLKAKSVQRDEVDRSWRLHRGAVGVAQGAYAGTFRLPPTISRRPAVQRDMTLHTAYTHYWITGSEPEPGEVPKGAGRQRDNGRVEALEASEAHPGLVIWTGVQHGDIPAVVRVHESEPELDGEGWDEIVEGDLQAESYVQLGNLDGQLQEFDLPGPGHGDGHNWRVRLSVKGADDSLAVAYEEDGRELTERHRIDMWPAPETGLLWLREDARGFRKPQ
ncbi:hypothetical protein [Streptomyces sp. NPDC050504]|uniref:hypothetical protein n=1 Tax=Streptomyces sp. NPDC050504 TaxID=3365618 RepID=UPI0037942073